MTVPPTVLDLVDRFDRNREAYHAGQFNETQVTTAHAPDLAFSLLPISTNCTCT